MEMLTLYCDDMYRALYTLLASRAKKVYIYTTKGCVYNTAMYIYKVALYIQVDC